MKNRTLVSLLRRSADAVPGAVAVIDEDRTMTYGELDHRSDHLASWLVARIPPEARVGLYLEKSLESVVGVWGALKAGAAYVPLDVHAPLARSAAIIRDCQLSALLTAGGRRAVAGELGADAGVGVCLSLDAPIDAELEAGGTGPSPPRTPGADDLAYLLYTSGSTGAPKGVMLTHRNALAFVDWAVDTFGVTSSDRLSNHAPLHFDLSIFDVFAAASAGAPVVLVPARLSVFPADLKRFIATNGITIWYSVPSVLSMLALRGGLEPGDLPGLRRILFAGEVFPTKYLGRLMRSLPGVRFSNLYGPTETNVCTWFDVNEPPEPHDDPVPVGRPIAGVEIFALTEDGRRTRPGEVGELCVRGATVMRGYWGAPELTSSVFVADPALDEGPSAYRTGDLAFRDEAGLWRLVGRRDDQIKSRGYRIELGDVESVLYAHPAVVECAVVAVPDELVSNRLHAHVVVRGDADPPALAEHLIARVPRYMVPDGFTFHDSLPKTSTGKIDKRALVARQQSLERS